MGRVKILIDQQLPFLFAHGGANTQVMQTFLALQRQGVEVEFLRWWDEGQRADLILSDMAPNLSGIGAADAARSAHLWELALEFALQHLKPDGRFLTKAFQGSGYSQFVHE